MSQPNARSRSSTSLFSTPSATTTKPEVVPEIDRRPHDHLVLLVEQEVGDEALVDLQFGHRQSAQVAERRVAGAEVVDRQPDADLVELVDGGSRARRVDEQRRLGDLEREHRRIDAVRAEVLLDALGELRVEQVVGRQVDGQPEVVPAVVDLAEMADAAMAA